MGTYAVAARNDGFLYVTAQNKNMIYLFDPADIRAGDTGFAPYLVTLGFVFSGYGKRAGMNCTVQPCADKGRCGIAVAERSTD